MSKAAPKPKFMMLGKSKYVHAIRTKAWDLKNSQCLQVRKYQVAGKVPKGKGISPEAASVLEPCTSCDPTTDIALLMAPERKVEDRKAKKDEVLDKFRPESKRSKDAAKKAVEPKAAAPKATKVGVRSTGSGERTKAEQLVEFAKANGWAATIDDGKPGLRVVADDQTGNQVIHCWFVDGKYDEARPAELHVGDWTGKLRGVHMCRRQIAGVGRDKPYAEPGKGRSGPRKKDADIIVPDNESEVDARRRVPFALDDEDIAIIDALKGKTIKWRNSLSNSMESAWLPAEINGKKRPKIFIQVHPKTRVRMVTFIEVLSVTEHGETYGGERTVRLDKIARVV